MEVHVKRENRTVAAMTALASAVGTGVVLAQQDPASPDQGGSAAVGMETWYTQPWVWIVMGVVLLLVILTLTSRGGPRRY